MQSQQVKRPVDERLDSAAVAAFHAAAAGAAIDYVTFELDETQDLPIRVEGKIKRHDSGKGFTVHDPTPSDLLVLAGYKLVRVEVAIDLWPKRSVAKVERSHQLVLIHRFVCSRLWSFDGPGIYPVYRVSPAPGESYKPKYLDEHGDAEGWRLPLTHETLYQGHRYDYRWQRLNVPSWAQVKLYLKLVDQGQDLSEEQRRVRTEVTIAQEGLHVLKISSTADLLKFNYRELSVYFRLLQPSPVTLKPHPNRRRIARKDQVASPFIRAVRRHAREVLCQLALDEATHAGMMSLVNGEYGRRVSLGVTHRDAAANRKMTGALDNLTKKLGASITAQ